MKIEYKGVVRDAWACFRYSYADNAENGGRPIDLVCRLEAALGLHGDVTSLCEFR